MSAVYPTFHAGNIGNRVELATRPHRRDAKFNCGRALGERVRREAEKGTNQDERLHTHSDHSLV